MGERRLRPNSDNSDFDGLFLEKYQSLMEQCLPLVGSGRTGNSFAKLEWDERNDNHLFYLLTGQETNVDYTIRDNQND